MNITKQLFVATAALAAGISVGTMMAATASASPPSPSNTGWVAVASSPSRESLDWGYGPDAVSAESNALARCSQLQNASNCRVLASGSACVATSWDAAQPLNRPHGASSTSSEDAVQAALAAAGPYANDPTVRCTWASHN